MRKHIRDASGHYGKHFGFEKYYGFSRSWFYNSWSTYFTYSFSRCWINNIMETRK